MVLTSPRARRYPTVALGGVVAQLVEHHNGIVGVIGSNPFGSTIQNKKPATLFAGFFYWLKPLVSGLTGWTIPRFEDAPCFYKFYE